MPEFTGHNDLRSYLRVIWRWKWLFLALLVAAPAITYFLERGKPKIYASSALVGIASTSVNTSVTSGSSNFQTTNVDAIAQILKTTPIANIAGSLMTPKEPGSAIINDISTTADPTTNLVTIKATADSPAQAAAVANAFAQALNVNQRNQAISQIQSAIAGIKSELSHISKNNPDWASLQQQLDQLEASLKDQNIATVLQPGEPNSTPVGPHLRRSVELGLVIGLLLAFGAVMLVEGADRRLRSPDDLESLTTLPLLAAIPPSAFSEELDTGPIDEESFQMLRTSLTYFTTDRSLASVLITSPGEKEGKSTVAARLALAAANAGLDVVLVDADLRRAGASSKFGIRPQAGLGAVLAGQRHVDSVTVDWPLTNADLGRLRIVPAGPPPINASALVSSDQMRHLLTDLEERSDLVIIDSPAALAVSDAVPLMRVVSGIVLVARMNRSSQDTIGRLQKIIASTAGNLLGVVATGVTAGGYDKYSQDYYGPVDHGRGGRFGRRRKSRKNSSGGDGVPLSPVPTRRTEPPHVEASHSDQVIAD
jgi:polysaccharide biosynthesis transport protein